MPAVTLATILSNAWNTIFDEVKNISDPEGRGTPFVFAAFPNTRDFGVGQKLYPLVVIEGADQEELAFVIKRASPFMFRISLEITIFTTAMEQLDSVSDDIVNRLYTSESTLVGFGLNEFKVNSTPVGHTNIGDKTIHERTIRISMEATVWQQQNFKLA